MKALVLYEVHRISFDEIEIKEKLALVKRFYCKREKLNFIHLWKPIDNTFAESFVALSDACPNENWSIVLRHAKEIIESWRRDCNEVRPHTRLKDVTPKEYAEIAARLLSGLLLISG
jgi:transposase InsO family protein